MSDSLGMLVGLLKYFYKEIVMSVVKQFNESIPTTYRNEQSRMLAERTQMLIDISKKAREESLTLQETNDLYAEFNKAYDLSNNTVSSVENRPVEVKAEIVKAQTAKVEEAISLKKLTEQTLAETTRMLARSVNTLKESQSIKVAEPLNTVGLDGVDESWAIQLLKESELDDGISSKGNSQAVYRQMIQPVLCEA